MKYEGRQIVWDWEESIQGVAYAYINTETETQNFTPIPLLLPPFLETED
jgi:hypothetical protein